MPSSMEAAVVLNEILADPPSGLAGDANQDGIRSTTQDEFIEILNFGDVSVDLSGWSLSDAVKSRHVFPAATSLDPKSYLVVFGGGSPALVDIDWQIASSGSLGLNNSGDTLTLSNEHLGIVYQMTYGAMANKNQSIVLSPEGSGTDYILHTAAVGSIYSPGTGLVESPVLESSVVPEWPSFAYFLMSGAFWFMRRFIA